MELYPYTKLRIFTTSFCLAPIISSCTSFLNVIHTEMYVRYTSTPAITTAVHVYAITAVWNGHQHQTHTGVASFSLTEKSRKWKCIRAWPLFNSKLHHTGVNPLPLDRSFWVCYPGNKHYTLHHCKNRNTLIYHTQLDPNESGYRNIIALNQDKRTS